MISYFDLQGTYIRSFKFDFEKLKELLLQTGEIFINFWWRHHRSHSISVKL